MESLLKRAHQLSKAEQQVKILSEISQPFSEKINNIGFSPLKAGTVEILQINLGKMCNQVCSHCHVDAGPDRKEIMALETLKQCLRVIEEHRIPVVDLTGGAPEMNPYFRWFVSACFKLKVKIMVRCNLTIILANKKYHSLPDFFKEHKVEVVSSLPFYTASRTDKQRGAGVFEKSVEALKLLNNAGYGKAESGLVLNLVYNPAGAFLPGSQTELEKQFKKELKEKYNIEFNRLLAITNMPVSRFLESLLNNGQYEQYMQKLIDGFNPLALQALMCKNTISVGWDGKLYDCDFNQMLEIEVSETASRHIGDFNLNKLQNRKIALNNHCYGCTAGSGSGCGGATV
ncbi:MAG: arsenosugar biosynthesis radical SAM protein ArsS [Bacteroidetes bacterium]|nr:arsenosugar biosynthesis radical SAM protein ArsS [Bacteroidota bacterium]